MSIAVREPSMGFMLVAAIGESHGLFAGSGPSLVRYSEASHFCKSAWHPSQKLSEGQSLGGFFS